MGDQETKPYRFVARHDPRDGTESILVREASEDGPAVRLTYDPDRLLPPVDLTAEDAARAQQFVSLEEVEAEDAAASKDAALAAGEVPMFTEDELKAKDQAELTEIAQKRAVDPVPSRKAELVAAILEAQKGVSS